MWNLIKMSSIERADQKKDNNTQNKGCVGKSSKALAVLFHFIILNWLQKNSATIIMFVHKPGQDVLI